MSAGQQSQPIQNRILLARIGNRTKNSCMLLGAWYATWSLDSSSSASKGPSVLLYSNV